MRNQLSTPGARVGVACAVVLAAAVLARAQIMMKEAAIPVPAPSAKAPAPSAHTPDGDTTAADEAALRAVGLPTDGPGLLDFFRRRAAGPANPAELNKLIAQLSDRIPTRRRDAVAALVSIGPAAVPLLRVAAKDPDEVERCNLAKQCLAALEGENSNAIPSSAAHLVAVRKPEGMVEVLLAYLPYVDNDAVMDDVKAALSTVAYRHGEPSPALVHALADKLAIRRAVAIDALCEGGVAEPRATLRHLLTDPKPIVRLKAALALANAHEAKAVSTLITLLLDLPQTYGKQAEDFLAGLAGEQGPKITLGPSQPARERCAAAWAAWWLGTEHLDLVGEVTRRTPKDVDRKKVKDLIAQLADDDFPVRQRARADLIALGSAATPMLRDATNSDDAEIRDKVHNILDSIEQISGPPLSATTVRLIAYRKPKGAAAALLAYLPLAEEGVMREEVQTSLTATAYRDGKPEPAVLEALHNKVAARRLAAIEALCQTGMPYPKDALRPLLQDRDPAVRLQAALSLANVLDRDAVPVLIAAVGEMAGEESASAEEYLERLAGDQAPAGRPDGDDQAARQKRRAAWAAWWKNQGDKIELVATRGPRKERFLGYTLLVLNQNNIVQELDKDGHERWQINGVNQPMDAHVLPGEHVLIAEYGGNRVTERNLKGDVLWQHQVQWPMNCQRLPNGNTFIVSRHQMIEVTRSGREVIHINRPMNDILAARKLKNGQIGVALSNGTCARMDSKGKELSSFSFQSIGTNGVEVLPNGGLLSPTQWQGKVLEYDPQGKITWQADFQQSWTASRAPNGHTMVGTQMWPPKVYELDKEGKVVWEHDVMSPPMRVRKR